MLVSSRFIQHRPHHRVILFAVAFGEGGLVGDGALDGAGGKGGVENLAGAGGHFFNGVSIGAAESDAGEAFAGGEDDAGIRFLTINSYTWAIP